MKVGSFLLLCPIIIGIWLHNVKATGQSNIREKRSNQPKSFVNSAGCGISNHPSPKILRGRNAPPHAYPWAASIREKGTTKHVCGGSLISEQYVLTTASCLGGCNNKTCSAIDSLDVILGAYSILHGQPSTQQKFDIFGYRCLKPVGAGDEVPQYNDIAVLQLDKKAKIDPYVNTVCLGGKTDVLSVNQELTLIGWGRPRYPTFVDFNTVNKSEPSDHLKEGIQVVIDNDDCTNFFHPVTKTGRKILGAYKAGKDILCTMEKDGFMMIGDFGGPLMKYDKIKSKFIQLGIGTYRVPRGGENAYTNVLVFRDWVESAIRHLEGN